MLNSAQRSRTKTIPSVLCLQVLHIPILYYINIIVIGRKRENKIKGRRRKKKGKARIERKGEGGNERNWLGEKVRERDGKGKERGKWEDNLELLKA